MSIILAYDGRPAAQRALDFAVRYAEMSGLPLYIFSSVISRDVIEKEDEFAEVKKDMGAAGNDAKLRGIEVHSVIEPGPAAENTLVAALRFNCDIIVIGRSDKTILDRVVLG
ncbi:MAG: universal stress protein, partial [Thermoplasmatales archaeon]|nr:universal stress protein [Thermoplasmatales archaeon]